jgi:hypothetical protein
MTTTKSQLIIDNINAYSRWGVLLVKGAYKTMRQQAELKDYIKNDVRSESGTRRPVGQRACAKERDLQISLCFVAATDYDVTLNIDAFVQYMRSRGSATMTWQMQREHLQAQYIFKKLGEPQRGSRDNKRIAVAQLTLTEPNPDNRAEI